MSTRTKNVDSILEGLNKERHLDEDKWVTMKGTHVLVDDKGDIKNEKLKEKIKGSKGKSSGSSTYSEALKKPKYNVNDKLDEVIGDVDDLTDDFGISYRYTNDEDYPDGEYEVYKAKKSFVNKIDKAVMGSYGVSDKFTERFGNLSKDTKQDIEDELEDSNDEEAKKAWETVNSYKGKLESSLNNYINDDFDAPKIEGYSLEMALDSLRSNPSEELGIDFDDVAKSYKIMDEFCTKNKIRIHTA